MAILLMYESHDMRHTSIPQVDGGQRDPWDLGRHILEQPRLGSDLPNGPSWEWSATSNVSVGRCD